MIPLRDANPSRRKPIVTVIIIILNLFIFLFQTSLPPDIVRQFIKTFGFIPYRFTYDLFKGYSIKVWLTPIFTSMFLHGSWMHLISNMWALWLFGDNVEDRLGHFKFLVFYLLSGFAAAMTHYIFNFNSPVVTIGASGAISGVMGAYFIMFPFARIITLVPVFGLPLFVRIPSIIYIGFWFLSQVSNGILTLFGPIFGFGIAWWAHIGGFLFGVFVANKVKKPIFY